MEIREANQNIETKKVKGQVANFDIGVEFAEFLKKATKKQENPGRVRADKKEEIGKRKEAPSLREEVANQRSHDKAESKEDKGIEDKEIEPEKKKELKFKVETVLINSLNMANLIEIIKSKILDANVIEKSKEFEAKKYFFKLDISEKMPLEMTVKKIGGKLAIVLFASGELKEDLLKNLQQLTDFLQNRGVNIAGVHIQELEKSTKERENKRQRQNQEIEIVEKGDGEENFEDYL